MQWLVTRLYTSCALPVNVFKEVSSFFIIEIVSESAEEKMLSTHVLAWQVDYSALRLNDTKLHLPSIFKRWPRVTGLVLWKYRPPGERWRMAILSSHFNINFSVKTTVYLIHVQYQSKVWSHLLIQWFILIFMN